MIILGKHQNFGCISRICFSLRDRKTHNWYLSPFFCTKFQYLWTIAALCLKWVFRSTHCKNSPNRSSTVSFTQTTVYEYMTKQVKHCLIFEDFWLFATIYLWIFTQKSTKRNIKFSDVYLQVFERKDDQKCRSFKLNPQVKTKFVYAFVILHFEA